MIAITCALIAAIAAIMTAFINAWQSKKIKETHKQVSENSHKNEKPTILDMISDLRDEQVRTNAMLSRHLEWHIEKDGK